MIATERMNLIMERLREKNTVTIKEIAAEFNISEATVRRDFEKLDEQGLVTRVRAGATYAPPTLDNVAPLVTSEKMYEHMEDKERLAKAAAELVQDGECVFLDGGTTVAPIIDHLQHKRIKIVTHNLIVTKRLNSMDADIFLVGGHYTHFHESTVGAYAEQIVAKFHFDHAFFGCSSIDLNRLIAFNDDIDTVPIKEIAMKSSSKNYLLADGSKLGKTSFCRFSSLEAFDGVLVTKPEGLTYSLPRNFVVVP